MLQFPDARMLAPRADGVVLVVRAGRTSRDVARTAIERLMDDGVPITGVVLNDWNPRDSRSANYGGYQA
jgi:Mrp family chromosome partitioning ATPase